MELYYLDLEKKNFKKTSPYIIFIKKSTRYPLIFGGWLRRGKRGAGI